MSEQEILNLKTNEELKYVEEFEFDKPRPIKGYPELHWQGKRPFTSTHYYPAQLKENYGEPVEGWMNKIYWGDNLQVLSHLLKEFRGKINLIYIDPPFDSKADYKKKVTLRGQSVESDYTSFEEKQYSDIWMNDEYFQFMYERLTIIRELLSENGSLYLHMDEKRSHYLKIILDEVFGPNSFARELIWSTKTSSGFKTAANNWIRTHDTILFFKRGTNPVFHKQYWDYSEEYKGRFKNIDKDGRYYRDDRSNGEKQFLDELKGIPMGDVWDDIMSFQQAATSSEILGYPTQKPESILERIIISSSNPGDLVLDCFMGSGTTQSVAMKLGRRFIGADINLGAVQLTTKRLIQQSILLQSTLISKRCYTGFSVMNVNNYDIFRNPIEAKELLIKALEINSISNNSVYDGEKDGKLVKIMPVNRITTKADLNDIVTNFDFKSAQKKFDKNPKDSVISLTLVCMGHEPDLAAYLSQQLKPFETDIEVIDILRDKQHLQFKRDSEAEIEIEDNMLIIKSFYPMNLLSKLSMQKEKVKNWKQMVESIMIDFNYDGAVLEPQIVDVPEGEDYVKGKYKIPADAGTIKIKITDLLSESYEEVINNG